MHAVGVFCGEIGFGAIMNTYRAQNLKRGETAALLNDSNGGALPSAANINKV